MQKHQGYLLATVGGLVAAAGGAQAADLPVKAARAVPPPAPSWAGWYIGLHAGGAWQHVTASYAGSTGSGGYAPAASGSSFIGGAQIGYNWQRGNLVYGFEVDGSGLTRGARAYTYAAPNKGPQVIGDIKWLSTARLRLGLAVGDTMAYMTGGLAVAGVKNAWAPNGLGQSPGGEKVGTKTKVGWTIGGGVEHMWTRNWTIALEALFVDLGRNRINAADPTKASIFNNQAVIGRAKLNYKF